MAGEVLIEVMKQAAAQAVPKEALTDVLFGKVISVSPLSINVEGRLELDQSLLLLSPFCNELKINIPIPSHGHTATSSTITVPKHKHTLKDDASKETSESDSTTITPSISITDNPGSTVEVTVWEGLKAEDQVALLRVSSGQQYIVLFKVGA